MSTIEYGKTKFVLFPRKKQSPFCMNIYEDYADRKNYYLEFVCKTRTFIEKYRSVLHGK
jgi:hypothetical protein